VNLLAEPWPHGFKWPRFGAHFRTPVDDAHTLFFSVTFIPYIDGEKPKLPEGVTFDKTAQLHNHRLQDYQAIVSQGEIYDRTAEDLGVSDRGVIMLRRIIMEGIQAVQRGEDPKGLSRSPKADRILKFEGIVVDSLMNRPM
jgi:5,5'-dehydrodivanillate O-demethylase